MSKFLALCGAVLFFSLTAAAQDNSTAPATDPVAPAASPKASRNYDLPRWQVGINYAYTRFRPSSTANFNLHGFNTSAVFFMNNWFGLEGDAGAHFGTTPSSGGPGILTPGNLDAKLILYGGGPRIAHRGNRFEPWAHAVFGGAHFRFTQTGGASASLAKLNAFSLATGGGVDFKFGPRVAIRVQGDFLGTRFFSTWQKSAQAQAGFVFSF